MMKGLQVISLGLLVAWGIVPASRATAAQPCPAGCGFEKRACLQTDRLGKLVCKQDCRANAEPTALGSCMRACSTASRSNKTGCQSDHATCLDGCTPPHGPPSSCLGNCGQALAACTQGVVAEAKSCVADCRTASDHLGCLKGCVAAAKQGRAACASDFQTCRADCAGSPSGAFFE